MGPNYCHKLNYFFTKWSRANHNSARKASPTIGQAKQRATPEGDSLPYKSPAPRIAGVDQFLDMSDMSKSSQW